MLPPPKKIEVFVKRFYSQRVAQANRTVSASSQSHHYYSENWVTVSPKKRVKSMIHPRPFKSSVFKPKAPDQH